MDPAENPFSPGAGSPPPELVGREPILDLARILLIRVKGGKPEKSLLFTGLRGVGKTVLLNAIEKRAKEEGYKTLSIEAQEDRPLALMLAPYLKRLLFELDRIGGIGTKVKRSLAVLRSFISSFEITFKDFSLGFDVEAEKGAADSGDLGVDLTALFIAIGEAAKEKKSPVALFIDEIQYLNQSELGALIMAMHKMQQLQLPLVLFAAGLPVLPGLAGDSKSYAERLFNFPEIGALSREDAEKALREPARSKGIDFEPKALEHIYQLTKGYPYFLQEWGYQVWNFALQSPISLSVVQDATLAVIMRLDANFFKVRFDRLTPGEKKFLRAMAELPGEHYRLADVATLLQTKVSALSTIRAKLIKKGMIYSPTYGDLAFTVPLFDPFLKRAIPH